MRRQAKKWEDEVSNLNSDDGDEDLRRDSVPAVTSHWCLRTSAPATLPDQTPARPPTSVPHLDRGGNDVDWHGDNTDHLDHNIDHDSHHDDNIELNKHHERNADHDDVNVDYNNDHD